MTTALRFAARRVARGLLTLWFAVTATFLLLRLLPGNPALAVANPNMTKHDQALLLSHNGQDQPLIVHYGK